MADKIMQEMLSEAEFTDHIARELGAGDMGPGISLSSALMRGMAEYYPDDPVGCAKCVAYNLRRAARMLIEEVRDHADAVS